MSTSPETEDRLISVLSRWLGRDIPNEQLRRELEQIGTTGLDADAAAAVKEVLVELDARTTNGRAHLDRVVRETIEFLALGG
jgi:hypothetical protein